MRAISTASYHVGQSVPLGWAVVDRDLNVLSSVFDSKEAAKQFIERHEFRDAKIVFLCDGTEE